MASVHDARIGSRRGRQLCGVTQGDRRTAEAGIHRPRLKATPFLRPMLLDDLRLLIIKLGQFIAGSSLDSQ
jgi:hypothetical protein